MYVYLRICPVASSCSRANTRSRRRHPLLYRRSTGHRCYTWCSLPTTQTRQQLIAAAIRQQVAKQWIQCPLYTQITRQTNCMPPPSWSPSFDCFTLICLAQISCPLTVWLPQPSQFSCKCQLFIFTSYYELPGSCDCAAGGAWRCHMQL